MAAEKFTIKALVEGRINGCIAKVMDSLHPLFSDESLSDKQKEILADSCVFELARIVESPDYVLRESVDGQKLYSDLYGKRELPQAIRDERLEYFYSLLFPRVAHLVCRIPGLVDQWQKEAWPETFRRLDDLALGLADLTIKVDELANRSSQVAGELHSRIRRTLLQKVAFKIDLTGLRGDRPEEAALEQMFVVPEIWQFRQNARIRLVEESAQIAEFLGVTPRNVIVAGGGAGKSTWLLRMQQQGLLKTGKLVLMLHLRDWQEAPLPSKEEVVRGSAGLHLANEVTHAEVGRWVDAGGLAFLVDGFDELSKPRRDEAREWLDDLSSRVGACPIVVTSRPLTSNHIDGLSKEWQRWQVAPFDPARVQSYIAKWYECCPLVRGVSHQVDSRKLALAWKRDQALSHLTGNPLMLATLLMVHHLDGALPKGRADVYERYISGMLGLWDDRRRLNKQVSVGRGKKRHLLTRLALRLHLQNTDGIDEDSLLMFLEEELRNASISEKADSVLAELRERSGLIVGPGTYEFIHKSVGEYLIAKAIDDGQSRDDSGLLVDRMRLFQERHDDRWTNIMFFWLGLARASDIASFSESLAVANDLRDRALFAGILFESSDRIPTDKLRAKYEELLKGQFAEGAEVMYLCAAIQYPTRRPFRVAEIVVRGMHETSLWKQIDTLVADGKLRWRDLARAHEQYRPRLWLSVITMTKDNFEFRVALSSCPFSAPEIIPGSLYALYLISSWWETVDFNIDLLRERVMIVEQVAPDTIGAIPLSLLCNLSSALSGFDSLPGLRAFHWARAIVAFQNLPWNHECLQWTKKALLPARTLITDLLQELKTYCDHIGKMDVPAEVHLSFSMVLKYLDGLIEQRRGAKGGGKEEH